MDRVAYFAAILGSAVGIARGDLAGTSFDGSLRHGVAINFTAVYGTPLTVVNPFRPETGFGVLTPAPLPPLANSLLLDLNNFAYSDFPGETGTLVLTGIDEPVDSTSLVMFTRSGVALGSVAGGGSSITATWAADDVNAEGFPVGLVIGWNSIPSPGVAWVLAGGVACVVRRARSVRRAAAREPI